MTISVPGQLVYSSQGDGVTTEFTYPVRFEEASELVVISREDGVDTVLTLNTDYTVAGAGLDAGGTVTMLYTPTAAEEIVRYRDTAAKQIVNLADSTRNPAEAVENQLDRFAMNAQDQAERLSRAVLARPGSTGQTLPEPEADKIIMWNTDGDALINRTVGEQNELVPGVNVGDIISTNNGSDFADPLAVPANIGAMPVAVNNPNNVQGDAFDSGNHSGFTAADVATKTIPAVVMSFVIAGFAAFGDGAQGAEYFRTASQPAHALYLTDSSGAFFELRSNKVKLSQAGAFPDTGTTQHVAIQNALDYIISRGGGTVDIDKPGEYLSDGPIQAADFTCKIEVTNSGQGVIKAAAGLNNNVLFFGRVLNGETLPGQVHLHNVKVDNSEGAYVVGDNSCTGISFRLLDQVYCYNSAVIGGFDPLVGITATGGDSGIGITQCNLAVIVNPRITGQPDTAIYPSWNNSGDIGGTVMVFGGHFSRNNLSMTPKRNLKNFMVFGGEHEEQPGGIICAWVNNSGWVEGPKSVHIDGAKFKKITSNAVRTVKGVRLTLRNIKIEDIGYNYDGTGNVGGNARAIQLFGTKGATIENIDFEMVDWAPVAEYAFLEDDDVTSGTTYLGGGHSVRGITFKNWSRTYVATASSTDEASLFDDLYYTDGSAPFFSGEATNHQFCYRLQGNPARYERRAGAVTKFGSPRASLTVDVSAIGVLGAGAKSSIQTYAAPGVDSSTIIRALEKLSTFSAAVEIIWSGRCVTDAIEITFLNVGAAGYDFAGKSIRAHFEYA